MEPRKHTTSEIKPWRLVALAASWRVIGTFFTGQVLGDRLDASQVEPRENILTDT